VPLHARSLALVWPTQLVKSPWLQLAAMPQQKHLVERLLEKMWSCRSAPSASI
jgi:hypothetical protein